MFTSEKEIWMNRFNITERGAAVFIRLMDRPRLCDPKTLGSLVQRLKTKHIAMPTAMVRRLTTEDGRIKESV